MCIVRTSVICGLAGLLVALSGCEYLEVENRDFETMDAVLLPAADAQLDADEWAGRVVSVEGVLRVSQAGNQLEIVSESRTLPIQDGARYTSVCLGLSVRLVGMLGAEATSIVRTRSARHYGDQDSFQCLAQAEGELEAG